MTVLYPNLCYNEVCLFVSLLYFPVNNFSVKWGWFPVFLSLTSTKQRIKYLVHKHNEVSSVSLEPATLGSKGSQVQDTPEKLH